MTLELKLEEAIEEALEKVAIRMLRKGDTIEEVSQIVELPIARLKELAENLK